MDDSLATIADDIRTGGNRGLDRLKNLKAYFTRNRHDILRSWGASKTTKDSFHALIESLFSYARLEKAAYVKNAKASMTVKLAGRLSLCASGLRNAVQLAGHKFKTKMVTAVIRHIMDTLPTTGDGYFEPLCEDYLKTLSTILAIPHHVEHLSGEDWLDLVDFCLQGASSVEQDSQRSDQNGYRHSPSITEANSGRVTPSRNVRAVTIRSFRQIGKISVDDLMLCLEYLTAAPNCPLLEVTNRLFDDITRVLRSSSPTNKSNQSAFAVLNSALLRSLTEKPTLSRSLAINIVPIIRRFWEKSSKSPLLRDEMLITLTLIRKSYLALMSSDHRAEFENILESLLEVLQSEYSKLFERDQIQLEDVTFSLFNTTDSLDFADMHMHLASPKAEHNWTLLQTIADIVVIIETKMSPEDVELEPDSDGPPKKKARHLRRTDELLRIGCSEESSRLSSLQMLCFLFSRQKLDLESLTSAIDGLYGILLEESTLAVSWAMLTITSCARQRVANDPSLKRLWLKIWQLASRCAANLGTSRYASHLMHEILHREILQYMDCIETFNTIVSPAGLLSPPTLSDSTLLLWTKIMIMRSSINPSVSTSTLTRIVTWLRVTWAPEALQDRTFASQMATHARPMDMLYLLLTATGRSSVFPKLLHGPASGAISRACLRDYRNHDLVEYLLMTDAANHTCQKESESKVSDLMDALQIKDESDQLVLDLLQSKVDSFAEAWSSMIKAGNSRSNLDAAKIVCSLCIVTNAFVACISSKESKRTTSLRTKCDQLWEKTCESFLSEPEKLEECLDIIGSCLPSKMEPDARIGFVLNGISVMAPKLVNLLSRRKIANLNTSTEDLSLMEVDDSFTSSHSQAVQETATPSFIRYQLPVPGDIKSYRILVTARLYVLCSVFHLQVTESTVPMSPIEYLLTLEIPDLIACATVILEALLYQSDIDRDHANEVLEYIGTEIIGGYEFERCEAALCASVSVLEGLADFWVNDEGDDFCDSASQVYSWFINVASEQSIMSSRVHIELAKLLQRILSIDSDYSPEDSIPSPRTSLFKLLSDGDLLVKFEIGKNFSKIFGQFILKEHEVIFNDVLESLPVDSECIEGLCLRLFVLAELASKWHTLLRRCVYHIFETAGKVPASTTHAKYCLLMVSASLGLKSAQSLFKLFVSQILYTWLEKDSLRSIPYSIFGYSSLKALLFDIQDDITGQIMMRANDDEAQELSDCLEVPFEELLKASFPKVEAYSVAHDINTPKSQNSQPTGGEARVRKRLGTETFAQLVQIHFPSTLAVLFQTMDQYEQIERAFIKRPDYRVAHETLRDITQISFSAAVLPANQQPSFRAKYFLDELDFLCRRTKYDINTLWTPALFVFVARRLLDSIHPALGSLHACSVVRKLRILVSLAGETALQDYPLEMMLHALRPMVTNFHSSDDAIGLFQFLLDRGRSYLSTNPSFMASIALSALTSLKVFLNSPQDSTTQESEYNSTLSKAQTFHAWLCQFLKEYNSLNMPGGMDVAFKKMIDAAQKTRSMGNAIKGTYESALLQELLQDKEAVKSLLTSPAWNSVFDLLSTDFQKPPKAHDDILGDLDAANSHSRAVWDSVQRPHLGVGYLSWAGRVLGRAYTFSGNIQVLKRREHDLDLLLTNDISAYAQSDSKAEILLSLCEVLSSSSGADIGVVEGTLQSIATRLGDKRMFHDYEDILPPSLMKTLVWTPYYCPDPALESSDDIFQKATKWNPHLPVSEWVQSMALEISVSMADDPILGALRQILTRSANLALRLFPFILHRALLLENDGRRSTREKYSSIFLECFRDREESAIPHTRAILSALLYLRNQPLPHESTVADRENWLELDYADAATAALHCQMYKTAILFVEIQASRASRSSRRSSVLKFKEPTELLFNIFRSIDDPDSFYGVHKQPSLHSVMEEMEYEGSGLRNTSFQSASFDSAIRRGAPEQSATLGLVHSLNSANLKGLASALLSDTDVTNNMSDNYTNMFQTALALQQWDLPTPKSINSDSANTFRAFQSLNLLESEAGIRDTINDSISSVTKNMVTGMNTNYSLHSALGTLASLTHVDQLLSCQSSSELQDEWSKMSSSSSWMDTANFSDVSRILSNREILFGTLARQPFLRTMVKVTAAEAQLQEIRVLQLSLRLSRKHSALQTSLNTVTYLSDLVSRCTELGIRIDALVQYEVARALWDQGEMGTSIKMLQAIERREDLHKQALPLSRPELLATLGYEIAGARLEKPEEIIENYLRPAMESLNGVTQGDQPGRVFHEFASFCDKQLQNSDDLEDYLRLEKLRQSKEQEVADLDEMLKTAHGPQKATWEKTRTQTKTWFDLDDKEYQRLRKSREAFLEQSLENYLLCLHACDEYDNDVLRFCALWLDKSEDDSANHAVGKHIKLVGSRKFIPLMNQLSSRLLNDSSKFQALLHPLLSKICAEHPYHGMYQIFSISKNKGSQDKIAISRFEAGKKLVDEIRGQRSGDIWVSIHNHNITYIRFALEELDKRKYKPGTKVRLSKIGPGARLENDSKTQKIPPPTMKIDVRIDCNYKDVPRLVAYKPEFSIAGGVSAPKIVTAIASNGVQCKQLFKHGNDDLRQDAIMEQVFEQISNLLQDHRDTRQRNLAIRTYKVLPLTSNAGIIEFVLNTIPLHDYLLPAHHKYYPKDLKPSACRKVIEDAQPLTIGARVKAYRQVTEKFHPVLRYFFIERFTNPDEWFEKRLAYSRSTAAISILGYVLGLGDRHGHNILLDELTGEVVHIDLGVAFEQGRVLPVPEVVPFRLTRDLVDGMGITKTEGVFRRCCEFTLEALRLESYSMMTILDVLRYDPLYSWALSPVRMKRIQDAAEEAPSDIPGGIEIGKSRDPNEPSEAGRALTVVEKKLGKSLSVTATVNELIQQASDERNLAVLYCGWAAYV